MASTFRTSFTLAGTITAIVARVHHPALVILVLIPHPTFTCRKFPVCRESNAQTVPYPRLDARVDERLVPCGGGGGGGNASSARRLGRNAAADGT